MSSRASSNRDEINSISSISVLPPITVDHSNGLNLPKRQYDTSSKSPVSDNKLLFVPSETPDSRFESAEFQKRIGSPECLQCQIEQENRQFGTSQEHEWDSRKKDIVYIPSALPDTDGFQADSHSKKFFHAPDYKVAQKMPKIIGPKPSSNMPKSSRMLQKYAQYKDSRLYNSWEGGLHSYHIEDDDSDEEPLVFRYRFQDYQKKKKLKTPPKSPFRQKILSEIESRRFEKIKRAKAFSSSENILQGLQVTDEVHPWLNVDQTRDDFRHHEYSNLMQRNSIGKELHPINHFHHQPNPNSKEYVSGSEKGSQLFLKQGSKDKVKRPFLPAVDDRPQIFHGKTILRNPLAPVTLQERYKPVVVLRSKLDCYTDAIRDFLEYIIEEQKKSVDENKPIPLDQNEEDLVIYKDIDDIAHMKEMAKAMKFGLATLSNQTKSNPQGQLIKGTTRIRKIGTLDPSMSGYRYRTPHKMSVGGQSVFITAPTTNPQNEGDLQNISITQQSLSKHGNVLTGPKEHTKYVYTNNTTTTSAPPNTPYASTSMQTVGSEFD